jgi:UDP-N-acetylglucosamine 2-epimerase (non-hydrolysing)
MKVVSVVGARPNFVKIAPILNAMDGVSEIEPVLVHTGQHYDYQMSQAFFEDLQIRDADVSLGVGSGSHASQTAAIMVAFETFCLQTRPDLVMVVGDVNSTIACALTAKKLNIPVAHVEAGLRSNDISMPEEINRRCTDSISDIFFVSEPSGRHNLLREGVDESAIHYVGNVMIDTLFRFKSIAAHMDVSNRFELLRREYGLITLHRPANTENPEVLSRILAALIRSSQDLPLIFPVHPRTKEAIKRAGLDGMLAHRDASALKIVEPMRYIEFIGLMQDARLVLTDSGGIQEETTALGVPCLTMRDNTERPVTCEQGTNILIGSSPTSIRDHVVRALAAPRPAIPVIDQWDGHAAERVVARLKDWDRRTRRFRHSNSG